MLIAFSVIAEIQFAIINGDFFFFVQPPLRSRSMLRAASSLLVELSRGIK